MVGEVGEGKMVVGMNEGKIGMVVGAIVPPTPVKLASRGGSKESYLEEWTQELRRTDPTYSPPPKAVSCLQCP